MSLPETSDKGPRRSLPIPSRVLSSLIFTTLTAGVTLAFLVILTLISTTGNALASQPIFQAREGAGSTPTPACTLHRNYQVTTSANATMIPATNYVPGSGCSNCTVRLDLPFPYAWYDLSPINAFNLSSEGNLQVYSNSPSGTNRCLPQGTLLGAIMPYWDDLDTLIDDKMGYYTAVVGTAPDRIFAIRYRGGRITADSIVEYEVLLYEGQPRFDIIYGTVHERGYSATIGVQGISGGDGRWTTYSCNTQSIDPGTRLVFDRRVCPSSGSTLR